MRRLFLTVAGAVAISFAGLTGANAQAAPTLETVQAACASSPDSCAAIVQAFVASPAGNEFGALGLSLSDTQALVIAVANGDAEGIATVAQNNEGSAGDIAGTAAGANPGIAADVAKAVVAKVPSARADVQAKVIAKVPSAKDAVEQKVAEVPTPPAGGEQDQANNGGEEEEVVTGSIPNNNNNNNNDPIEVANNNAVENALQDTGEGSPVLP